MKPLKRNVSRPPSSKPGGAQSNRAQKPEPVSPPQTRASRDAPFKEASLQNPSPEGAKREGLIRKVFASPTWQGITGILALAAIGVSIWLYFYAQNIQRQGATANLTLTTTYQYDGSNRWTMNADVSNNGPAVASAVHLVYSALHTTCMIDELIFTPGKPTRVVNRSIKEDLQCANGSALISVTPVKALPGVFIHPLASYSASPIAGLFSGTAYDLHVGEDIWVNFNFKVTPDLNRKLMAELPSRPLMPDLNSPSKLSALFTRFSQVNVSGDNIKVTSTRYSAANLTSP
jgi:hypothetical protein